MTIVEAIKNATERLMKAGVPNARLDAEVLLLHVLCRDKAWLIAHIQDSLDEERRRLFEGVVNRRTKREPVQHIIGKQEFWGLDFTVTPDVLIPRPETELVVETAIRLADKKAQLIIIDLCTGSGCIAISLAHVIKSARIFANDASTAALVVARENARKHGASESIRFLEGDLFEPFQEMDIRGRVDIITANPPYVKSGDLKTLQPEVRYFEPKIALIAGPEGTEIEKKIIETAPEFLKKGGALVMEMGMGQAETLVRLVEESGAYHSSEILKDLAGIERVIVARRK